MWRTSIHGLELYDIPDEVILLPGWRPVWRHDYLDDGQDDEPVAGNSEEAEGVEEKGQTPLLHLGTAAAVPTCEVAKAVSTL